MRHWSAFLHERKGHILLALREPRLERHWRERVAGHRRPVAPGSSAGYRPRSWNAFARKDWRRRPDLNRGWRFCRPLPYHLATAPVGSLIVREVSRPCPRDTDNSVSGGRWRDACSDEALKPSSEDRRLATGRPAILERETGFEPATSTLARSHSTTELFPLTPNRPTNTGQTACPEAAIVPQRRRGNQGSHPLTRPGTPNGTPSARLQPRSRPPPRRRNGRAARPADDVPGSQAPSYPAAAASRA
jgi:hypothetical protein